jgi:hypothetical protein
MPTSPGRAASLAAYDRLFAITHAEFEKDAYSRQIALARDPYRFTKDPLLMHSSTTKKHTGMSYLIEIQEVLDMFGLKRSTNQRELHVECIKAVLPHLFQKDLDENIELLKKMFNTSYFQQEVLCVTPRQFGKTYAIAMFVAACAIVIPAGDTDFVQCIFSTGRRASVKMLKLTEKFITHYQCLNRKDFTITASNVETIVIRGPGGPTDVRRIYSYPSKIEVRYSTNHC